MTVDEDLDLSGLPFTIRKMGSMMLPGQTEGL